MSLEVVNCQEDESSQGDQTVPQDEGDRQGFALKMKPEKHHGSAERGYDQNSQRSQRETAEVHGRRFVDEEPQAADRNNSVSECHPGRRPRHTAQAKNGNRGAAKGRHGEQRQGNAQHTGLRFARAFRTRFAHAQRLASAKR
jgi:hypothetical protein